METKRIRTGIIGGSLRNRWASSTHIPALLQSGRHHITAVATTNMESAQEAAREIGAVEAYSDYRTMLASGNVDMIIVSVKVPYHKEIVLSTLKANKHLYCEWPLAANLTEVQSIMKEMKGSAVKHAIGLQSRQSDEVKLVKKLIDSGEIGRVLSVQMKVSTSAKGNWTDQGSSYMLDRSHGAHLLSIHGGHSLDIVLFLFGQWTEVQATGHTHYTLARLIDQGGTVDKNTEDQYLIQGKVNGGIPISVHLQGGAYPQFLLEVQGEQGMIRLYQPQSAGHPQYGGLRVSMAKYAPTQPITTSHPGDFSVVLEDKTKTPFTNVFRAHQAFAQDILMGSHDTPDFYDALALHRLIHAIQQAAHTGERIREI